MTDLKPCPFCGGEADGNFINSTGANRGRVCCKNDKCGAYSLQWTVAQWNTRADIVEKPDDKEVREAVEEIDNAYFDDQCDILRDTMSQFYRWNVVKNAAIRAATAKCDCEGILSANNSLISEISGWRAKNEILELNYRQLLATQKKKDSE